MCTSHHAHGYCPVSVSKGFSVCRGPMMKPLGQPLTMACNKDMVTSASDPLPAEVSGVELPSKYNSRACKWGCQQCSGTGCPYWHSLPLAQPVTGTACHWRSLSLAQPVTGTACHWRSLSLAQPVTGTACHKHSLSLAQPVTGTACHWLPLLTQSVTGTACH